MSADPELAQQVRRAVDGQPVRVVWLFGSRARGTPSTASDTDLAVLLDPGTPADQWLDLRLRLLGRLEDAGTPQPDVVLVDEAPLSLQARVAAEGQVVFSADEARRIAWTSRVFREHADFALLQKDLEQQMLRGHATGRR